MKLQQRVAIYVVPAVLFLSAILVGCGGKSEKPSIGGAETHDSTRVPAPAAATMPSESAHESANADGIVPKRDSSGTMLVGWDELVKHAPLYNAKRIHVKTMFGGSVTDKKKNTTGYLYPVDMDMGMMSALMQFIQENPQSGVSMPLICRWESKKEADAAVAGKETVVEGDVKILKKDGGTGFTVQRGIKEVNYVVLLHAKVLR